uniref:Uncharacterized protein n=1 Tax=Siphoviridae sp. ctoic9 TaxID=2825671 RepID=A0A8S5Q9X4_9CAUD|nr:MAG TPA: hypothetical protein [Siphoviridae sp. ctoic9]
MRPAGSLPHARPSRACGGAHSTKNRRYGHL